jgi:hypothetical protein
MYLHLASPRHSSRLSRSLFGILLLGPLLTGCPSHSDDDDDDDGIAILGGGSHSVDSVVLTEVATGSSELNTPRDLAFNPESPNDLYVVNHDNTGLTIIFDAASDDAEAVAFSSFGSDHFLIDPSSIAFGKDGRFATVHETDELTQGPPPFGTPEDFMGPTLWDSDPDVFDGGHSGHLDMLHNSPLAMGVAWEKENIYWVFDGYHSSITRYDFREDHGPGGTDHTDGVVARFVEGEVDRKPNTPSHMEFDQETDLLYIADTGNKRIAVLDTTTGEDGGNTSPNYDTAGPGSTGSQYEVLNADISTLVDGEEHNMTRPSGLALRDGVVYVSDNKRSNIMAYDMETGDLLDFLSLELEEGALMGIEFDADGNLWFADALDNRIVRISLP